MTGPINTAGFTEVRPVFQLMGDNGAEVCPAVQFSDDGVTWDAVGDVVALTWNGGAATYVKGTTEWFYGDTFVAFGSSDVKRFCRFGLLARNDTGSGLHHLTAQLHVDTKPVRSRTLASGLVSLMADASNGSFYATTGALPAGQFTAIRASWELADRSSSNFKIQAGMQTSEDGVEWDTPERVRSAASLSSTVGWDWGTVFEETLDDVEYVRFGILMDKGTTPQSGVARLIIEGRGS